MGSLEEKMSQLLQQRFGRRARVEIDSDVDGIIGKVVSTKFRGVGMRDRMDMVYDAVEGSLSPEEKRRIVILVPRTPEETRED
jgi:hypothetical protein